MLVVTHADSATYELFDARGLQGGGYTWLPIARALVALHAPELAEQLDFNAEGDDFYVYAASREPLAVLEQLIRDAATDHHKLCAAMEHAGDDLE